MINEKSPDDALDALLASHDIIAFDMDGTLINGPSARMFCAYIRRHPEKTFHIVTFRDEVWAADIPFELEGEVAESQIASINSCPQALWAAHDGGDVINMDNPILSDYVEWKGMCSKGLGATVLVDDLPHLVVPGCNRYGVEFIHAWFPFGHK